MLLFSHSQSLAHTDLLTNPFNLNPPLWL
jgi:hypothetical protein